MNVSVVIPAHDAAETLSHTLESLLAQTHPHWEAIVIDDGSRDGTLGIAREFSVRDERIRVISQSCAGVSAARNAGISLAQGEWLLFLDSDDWLSPSHLKRLTGVLAADPGLDAVHCGWNRVLPDGTLVERGEDPSLQGDLFGVLARRCCFAIHACLIRRTLVQELGAFDESMPTCEDWDLWQRVARTGARFGWIPDVLAYYRMRPASLTTDGRQFLTDGLKVIERGHGSDPRVNNTAAGNHAGSPVGQLSAVKFIFATWPAAVVLGHGNDARPLLEMLGDAIDPTLDPALVAACIFEAALLPRALAASAWPELWAELEGNVLSYLSALEVRAKVPLLASRARRILERMIVEQPGSPRPLTIGLTHASEIEVTGPLHGLTPPRGVERVRCDVLMEGVRIGRVWLPVCDGVVTPQVVADAIAAEYAWPVLGKFLEKTVYQDLRAEETEAGMSIFRGELCLADGLPAGAAWSLCHDTIGWTVFLQELWGCPELPAEAFYETGEAMGLEGIAPAGRRMIEVSRGLRDLVAAGDAVELVLTAGGQVVGTVNTPSLLSATELRAHLTIAGGFELCRVAVREGLLGRPMDQSASLRARLAASCDDLAEEPERVGMTLGRQPSGITGTSASRHARLPVEAFQELLEMAQAIGQPVLSPVDLEEAPREIVYAPDHLAWPLPTSPPRLSAKASREVSSGSSSTGHDGHHFESLFASGEDPWGYTNSYEEKKYAETLSLLPDQPIGEALELACAEGHFTERLAGHVDTLVAADISRIALTRAAERCVSLGNVRFEHCDLTKDPILGSYDLIVCSEVLYYVGGVEDLESVAAKIAQAIRPGGHFLSAHANLIADEPERTGFDWGLPFGAKRIGEAFERVEFLDLVKELRTPLYRVQLFRRRMEGEGTPVREAEIIEAELLPELPESVASHVSWEGQESRRTPNASAVVTARLPVLMYHRVAPEGFATTSRWRVTPEAFEEQLRYLRGAGFHSVSLEEWRLAAEARRPLPGRAILLTFDDGYRDFATHAWPLLKRYGFTAIVFLVAGRIGGTNEWDSALGEPLELMDWDEILALQEEGVEFGSHTCTHPPLTGLTPAGVVRELAKSRTILESRLGHPVTAFAYPYGDNDPVVQHLTGACGYRFGLTCRSESVRFQDSLLALPRIEIPGDLDLPGFVSKLRL
ncbi:trifunctional glycosyltransferase/class I SAM-dependent methyltransferase/polysaccharide deacetylase [Haloferula sp. BvORR071]|uniref:trifunctional glycosyltransferase/class I SAM-dependent methyltransferase/polysaccharide deacetylase n=1 Tax=Haloferula sp. BvORR071 TaxID=1396141 RepID=UPI000557F793|nr:trifunctional glycosyltransferase/class I SAM-dependent methyltransferase/polysaccharide deacetylase [Haloferula sp. BvORR071]